MTWSYSTPGASDKDWIRFRLGDTDAADPLLSDEEINAVLGYSTDRQSAGAECAAALASKFSRMATDEKAGDLSQSFSDRAAYYKDLSVKFVAESDGIVPLPYAGGISIADKSAHDEDTDRVKPAFTLDQFDP